MPLPQGFELEQGPQPKLPPGFQLEGAAPQERAKVRWGDTGSLLSAGEAFHGLNQLWDKAAYGLGEKTSDFATSMGASPETSASLGYGVNVAAQAGPALLGGKAASSIAEPAMQAMGRGLMKSAIKPPIADQRSGDAARAINTLLEQGYNPTKGGVEAMQSRISSLGDEISNTIANSTATIKKSDVGQALLGAYDRFKAQVNPTADLEALRKAWLEFRSHPDLIGQSDIPVQLAQKLKQGTYSQLGNKTYGELSGASTEAQKQLARGLKEGISKAVPEVSGMNSLQGELINAKEIAERRALMQGNNNPVSLPASIAAISHEPMAALGMWANTSSLAKSLLARMSYSGAERVPQAIGSGIGAAYVSGSGKAPTEQELMAEALRKKKIQVAPQVAPQKEQFLSPDDASIPLALRMR